MTLLIISNILLWVLLLLMGVVIFALTRQIGVLYERLAPAGALTLNKKLKVGDLAPDLLLTSIVGKQIKVGGQSKNERSQLLFFISPDCPVCKNLLSAMKSAARAESSWLDLILASDGMEQDHAELVNAHALESLPYIVSEMLGKTYGVAKLPYAVLIDEGGKIASMGIVNTREHIDSLFEAKEYGVGSLQEYMDLNQSKKKPI